MADFPTIGDNGGTVSGGAYAIYVKATNDQPAVFTSEASRDAFFASNPDELTAISAKPFMVGIGTTPEDPTSVIGINGWYAYNAIGFDAGWQSLATILRGERGEKGDSGSTPSVIVDQVSAPAHGFTGADALAGVCLRLDETDPRRWVRASNLTLETCAQVLLAEVVDANNLIVILGGVGNTTAHGFTGKQYLNTSGGFTETPPLTGWIQEVLTVSDADNIIVSIGQPRPASAPYNGTGVSSGGITTRVSTTEIQIESGRGSIVSTSGITASEVEVT